MKNFDHTLILREYDPLRPVILSVYEAQGIRNGAPTNKMKGPAFKTELATAYPECRLVVTKETMTAEGIKKCVRPVERQVERCETYVHQRRKCGYGRIRHRQNHCALPAVRHCPE